MPSTLAERQIRECLQRLRARHLAGDTAQVLCWVIEGELATAQRPLRDHPIFAPAGIRPGPLPPEARPLVETWVQHVVDAGVRSIICLLEPAQLERYYERGGLDLPGGGLLEYYRQKGFEVRHRPLTDYCRPSHDAMTTILQDFNEVPHPVLIHCSAGIDRTTPVAAFVVEHHRRQNAG